MLTSSQPFDVTQRPWLFTDAVPNMNSHVGQRIVRRQFKPSRTVQRRGQELDGFLGGNPGAMVAGFGAMMLMQAMMG